MKEIAIKGKKNTEKMEKTQKTSAKHSTSLDIKKINLQKDPNETESSLEYLILLLASSLNMTVE